MYPVNSSISKYSGVVESWLFCGFVDETAAHCDVINKLCVDLSVFLTLQMWQTFVLKDDISYYEDPKLLSAEYVVHYIILNAKFFIHKQKWFKSLSFLLFLVELDSLVSSQTKITKRVPHFDVLWQLF